MFWVSEGIVNFFLTEAFPHCIENHPADVEIDRQVEELSVRSGPTLWQCGGCGKQASQRGDLRKHIEAMHLSLCLPCHLCAAVYRTRHHRQHHLRTVHGLSMK